MNLDTFQQKRLDAYFAKHAPADIKARRESKKMTIKGAYEWIKTKLQKTIADDGAQMTNGGCIVGDDQWCYDEMMHYFTVCNEGDTFKTDKEIKAEEERQQEESERRNRQAEQKRKEHAERVARWQTLTPEQIAADIRRARFLDKHSWHKGKSDEELDKLIAEEAEREEARRKADEAAKKAAAEKAKAKAEREAEKKRKAEEKAKKEAEKKAAEERKAQWQAEQLSLF